MFTKDKKFNLPAIEKEGACTEPIINYLRECGYDVLETKSLTTKGATDCIYLVVTLKDGQKRFVKAGEKVDQEVKNILYLTKNGVDVIPPALFGSSEHNRILVTELFVNPDYGSEMVHKLHLGEVDIAQFLSFQNDVFRGLEQFYHIPVESNENKEEGSKMFAVRSQERLEALLAEQDTVAISGIFMDGVDVLLKNILHFPIQYLKSGNKFNLPGLVAMNADFKDNCIKQLPQTESRIIHGDFHAPNIAVDLYDSIRIIDISDVRYREDPNWDLGKWLNYLKIFFRAAERRNLAESDYNIHFSITENRINLTDFNESKIDPEILAEISDKAVQKFASMIKSSADLVQLRSAAAEFVVNLSTLRRHIKKYPQTVKNVLSCLCESYIYFKERFNEKYC